MKISAKLSSESQNIVFSTTLRETGLWRLGVQAGTGRLQVQGHLQVLEEIKDILQMTMIIRGTATMTIDVTIVMVKLKC